MSYPHYMCEVFAQSPRMESFTYAVCSHTYVHLSHVGWFVGWLKGYLGKCVYWSTTLSMVSTTMCQSASPIQLCKQTQYCANATCKA
eukprot:2588013-Amphidinium_carterae.1